MKKLFIILIGCCIFAGCTEYKVKKLYEQGQNYEKQFEWDKAVETYNIILKSYPKSQIAPQAQLDMAQCKEKIDKIDKLINETDKLLNSKKYESAIKNMEDILKLGIQHSKRDTIERNLDLTKLNLADEYYSKKGNKNKTKAFTLFKELAEKGYSYAQYSVGFMSQNGQGTSINKEEAEKWYRKAAEQGDESSKKELEKIEKNKKLDIQTYDRKSYKLYNVLGKNITEALRVTGGNYDAYKENFKDGYKYMCYFFGGHLVGGYWSRQYGAYVGGYETDVFYMCHKPNSKTIVGVGYRYPLNMMNISNLPKLEYHLPKSFFNLKYKSIHEPTDKRIYYIGDEEWTFNITEDMAGNVRVYATTIFLL